MYSNSMAPAVKIFEVMKETLIMLKNLSRTMLFNIVAALEKSVQIFVEVSM